MIPDFILDWARLPGPAALLAQARSRLEEGKLGRRARLAVKLPAEQGRQIARLLPVGWDPGSDELRASALRQALADNGTSLEAVLETTGGPLRDVRAERSARRAGLAAARAEAKAALLRALPALPAPLAKRVLSGSKPLVRSRELCDVLNALPLDPPRRLAVLAVQLFGDAHALDRSRRLGRSAAQLITWVAPTDSHAAEQSSSDDAPTDLTWPDPSRDVQSWHQAWASVGVLCDEVSSTVLVLNLPLAGDAPAVAQCAAGPGQPLWLTLRSLDGAFRLSDPAATVYVCENPTVVEAAADRLAQRCAPLVCTYGRPSLAAMRLLRGVNAAQLRVRADGDAVGHAIVEQLRREFPQAVPWRMGTEYEEELLDDLLADLDYRDADA